MKGQVVRITFGGDGEGQALAVAKLFELIQALPVFVEQHVRVVTLDIGDGTGETVLPRGRKLVGAEGRGW